MYAIITGASSGIGKEIARCLLSRFDVILVARNEDKLKNVTKEFNKISIKYHYNHDARYYVCDVSKVSDCNNLYNKYHDYDVQILVNGAGFGALGDFEKIDIEREVSMINTNITGVHVLTKLFLKDMLKKNRGYILNIASSASYMPGSPYMATYYATKAYVLNLTRAIAKEKNVRKSNVYIGSLCPGPVDTNFNNASGIDAKAKGLSARHVAKYTIRKMFAKKELILPGLIVKLTYFGSKIIPNFILLKFATKWQENKK